MNQADLKEFSLTYAILDLLRVDHDPASVEHRIKRAIDTAVEMLEDDARIRAQAA